MDGKELARYIDHTVLKPETPRGKIETLCREAAEHQFASVCVNPCWVATAAGLLQGSGVDITTVVGFPLGANTTAVKVFETEDAIRNGATEIDMVINVGALLSGDIDLVREDIAAIKRATGAKILKVILETCLLSSGQIRQACELSVAAGADYVKTSTGFGSAGATLEHVRLMRGVVGPTLGVKASGGVKNRADALAMIEAGASRIGTSAGVAICAEG
jgi:deoxyribose-phosphate aldolase